MGNEAVEEPMAKAEGTAERESGEGRQRKGGVEARLMDGPLLDQTLETAGSLSVRGISLYFEVLMRACWDAHSALLLR